MTLYTVKHKTGYCLTRQNQGDHVATLCQMVITLPLGIDEFIPGDGLKLCADCIDVLQSARGFVYLKEHHLRYLAQCTYQYGDRRGQVVYELAQGLKLELEK